MAPIWNCVLGVCVRIGGLLKRRLPQALLVGLLSSMLVLSDGLASRSANAETSRIVHADVVALDHLLVYNRFGSFNPFGMIFALRRDVTSMSQELEPPTADRCAEQTGNEAGLGRLEPGEVRLRDCKRPRPLVLRANAGDILEITLTNLLRHDQPGISSAFALPPQTSGRGFCQEAKGGAAVAPTRPEIRAAFGDAQCTDAGKEHEQEAQGGPQPGTDWPLTRGLSLVIPGLEPVPLKAGEKIHGACTGMNAIRPGQSVTCRWQLLREGTHLFSSLAAPAGGEGDAGSLGHGLFGALIVEPTGSRAFRSQVSRSVFERVWPSRPGAPRHARADAIDFNLAMSDPEPSGRVPAPSNAAAFACGGDNTIPVLSMRRPCASRDGRSVEEVVHGDLNAIIVPPAGELKTIDEFTSESERREWRLAHEAQTPFREFTAIFHDELKTFYAEDFKQLGAFGQLSGVRDGFGINYGASGVGTAMLANRLGIGPAANCAECLYEEFFLESWANGDPALLEVFPDDPSNVHHSYLNDKVVFRNFHAGKETHVFHLHSHQWFAGNDAGRGAYLDSQTIGPQQGFTYRIYHGGLERFAGDRNGAAAPRGWWDSLGSGNRNRTPGDAIFHCHLYPHFAQGMWALWRVHDVLEDGTRVLPDGQAKASLSVLPNPDKDKVRPGSVGRAGEWLDPASAAGKASGLGTPVPGLVPLPGQGLPMLPTYSEPAAAAAVNEGHPLKTDAMPGYPFYVAGKPGHRSPQPPLDMARAEKDAAAGIGDSQIAALGGRAHLDGGLPRHVVAGGVAVPKVMKGLSTSEQQKIKDKKGMLARMLALGDVTSDFEFLKLELLPQGGTVLERNAMAFHGTGSGLRLFDATGREPAERTVALTGVASAPAMPDLTTRLDPDTAAYPVKSIPLDGVRSGAAGAIMLADDARFAVNGSPGASGAPYADPCAAPLVFSRANGPSIRKFDAFESAWQEALQPFRFQSDPLATTNGIVPDPALIGFRRFDVSAVELKLIVNRAGWHDPQARINVLSKEADAYKGKWRSDAEPFFFRAFSGECIEFRHTNETPKTLKLDDFQLAVPTDTIGQHIHLVKFDVTSSDGSGNGFNYEDGTFAPDEVLERICKSRTSEGGAVTTRPGETVAESVATRTDAECGKAFIEGVSKRPRLEGDNIKYFQTTVQRWFADPILSDDGTSSAPGAGVADRTMRTVFTHDHFGPSNIQQHGFYSALLIEPSTHAVCPLAEANSTTHDGKSCLVGPAAEKQPAAPFALSQVPSRDLVGARANVFLPRPPVPDSTVSGDAIHIDSREYAIAIADFALLYDGKKGGGPIAGADANGLDRLVYEAATANAAPSPEDEEGETSPARFLRERDIALSGGDQAMLRQQRDGIRSAHGSPIAPPPRPEAISQRHHDPYLVNYRNEPIPLRVGAKSNGSAPSFLSNPCRIPGPQDKVFPAAEHAESIVRQRPLTDKGDLSDVFLSKMHGDPCTPLLEGLSGDRVVARLIQGAQEVQHTFVVEGRPGRRNVDQPFPSERPLGADRSAADVSRAARCATNAFARSGKPRAFATWATESSLNDAYWKDFAALVAGCDNPLGFVAAQEIGISEHFEVGALFSASGYELPPRMTTGQPGDDGPRPIVRSGRSTAAGRPSLDYLYHFGSTDALWNGAWGLVRSYDGPKSPDLAACLGVAPSAAAFEACLAGPTAVGARLQSFDDLRQRVRSSAPGASAMPAARSVEALPPEVSKIAGSCPVGSPHVEAIAVAVRAGKVLDKSVTALPGTVADKAGLFSRDGLLLVPVTANDLGLTRSLMDYQGGASLPKTVTQIQAIVADKLKRAGDTMGTPFVLRVRAGDCVDLMVINALPGSGEPWDTPGDALMPRIVPLNVDSDERQYGGSRRFDEWKREYAGSRSQIAPSRKVALSLPLPKTSVKPAGTLPVGVNDAKAISADGAGARVFEVTRHYAGFYWVGRGAVRDKARDAARQPAFRTEIAALIPNGSITFQLLQDASCEIERQVVVYGINLCIEGRDRNDNAIAIPAASRERVRQIAQRRIDAAFADDVNRKAVTRVIPYAFGALPIRAIGDVVSHGAQGLIGTLVVEPAAIDEDNNPVGPSRAHDFTYRHGLTATVETPDLALRVDGQPDVTIPAGSFREHVLLWQDGLNLWRRPRPLDSYLGFTDRPVPDCRVCDDSYDLGERGVSYRSAPFTMRLAGQNGVPAGFGLRTYPRDDADLNAVQFPPTFFAPPIPTPQLPVRPREEIALRVAHPDGRARQRAFVATTIGYDDLFPGFGSGHTTLLAPGKAMTAWGCAPRTNGFYLWRDGPQPIFAAGVWGHLSVGDAAPGSVTTCNLPGVD